MNRKAETLVPRRHDDVVSRCRRLLSLALSSPVLSSHAPDAIPSSLHLDALVLSALFFPMFDCPSPTLHRQPPSHHDVVGSRQLLRDLTAPVTATFFPFLSYHHHSLGWQLALSRHPPSDLVRPPPSLP